MTAVEDIGYGAQFDGWYDRIFPKDAHAEATARALAALHPDTAAGTLEFGVGTGRIAVPLSRETGPVVGVDSSAPMLAGLAAEAAAQGAPVTGVHADVRTYAEDRTYGLVYCICSVLGLITDPDDQRRTVRRAAALLAPGGRLVVETHNRPAVHALHEGRAQATFFTPYPDPGTGLQSHAVLLGPDLWQCHQIWFEADGSTRVGSEVVRLLTPDEVDAYAEDAGLTPTARWSDWNATPYDPRSPLFVTVYERGADA
ncbi:class I SAM-dependent methyltransferase [Streptomyces sp. NBC_01351]|uniref:class I SAM-dependent methyltransferase n=1 Tax=Streptomyces sp. NBC_01351 TaxID=2903833 RepID=UPI002E34D7BD|nr:class I SAM-dependent methyltransferase [Streptomyces sp. NBC_01351]